jgi:hypothetical protein
MDHVVVNMVTSESMVSFWYRTAWPLSESVLLYPMTPAKNDANNTNTSRIQAGNAVDCSIGVTFGLSTITAAAFGRICSDTAGVLFKSTVDSFFRAIGLPRANRSIAEKLCLFSSKLVWLLIWVVLSLDAASVW